MNVALENETKRFFLEFMNRHGGIEKFKTELLKFNRPSMPKFLLPLKGKSKHFYNIHFYQLVFIFYFELR